MNADERIEQETMQTVQAIQADPDNNSNPAYERLLVLFRNLLWMLTGMMSIAEYYREDFIKGIGAYALTKAARTYTPDRGRFVNYAYTYVLHEMIDACPDYTDLPYRISDRARRFIKAFKACIEESPHLELSLTKGITFSVKPEQLYQELADAMEARGIPTKISKIKEMLCCVDRLESGESIYSEGGYVREDVIGSSCSTGLDEQYIETEERNRQRKDIRNSLSGLDDMQYDAATLHAGYYGDALKKPAIAAYLSKKYGTDVSINKVRSLLYNSKNILSKDLKAYAAG